MWGRSIMSRLSARQIRESLMLRLACEARRDRESCLAGMFPSKYIALLQSTLPDIMEFSKLRVTVWDDEIGFPRSAGRDITPLINAEMSARRILRWQTSTFSLTPTPSCSSAIQTVRADSCHEPDVSAGSDADACLALYSARLSSLSFLTLLGPSTGCLRYLSS